MSASAYDGGGLWSVHVCFMEFADWRALCRIWRGDQVDVAIRLIGLRLFADPIHGLYWFTAPLRPASSWGISKGGLH